MSAALTLVPRRTRTAVVRGRQTIERVACRGIFFVSVGEHLRSCYLQIDGTTVLADECSCCVEWPEEFWPHGCALTFVIRRNVECPIDEHKLLARSDEGAA